MAVQAKNYLDLTGLQAYDALIKSWANSDSQVAYKTVAKSTDGNSLLFFKKAGAVVGTDTADATISLGNTDMQTQLDALATIVGATYDSQNETYSIALDASFGVSVDDVVDALNELKSQINILNGNDTTAGSVAKAIKDAVGALNTSSDVGIASQSGKAITITGSIKEENGIIADGSATDITLADVASTGAAEDVSTAAIDDGEATPTQLYAAGTVQGILEAIARDLNDLGTESAVTVEKQATAESGYISTYVVKQNGIQVGEKINIPKDYLVKSASVQSVTVADQPYSGAEVGDKYIDFVINTRDGSGTDEHLYLPLDDLMAAISGGTTSEATVSIDAHNVITVSIVKIAASKIAYSNTTSGSAVEETVQAALARIDGDASTAGSINKAKADVIGTASDTASADTVNGAKAYADAAVADLDGSATIASVSGDVITIKGAVSETDGVVDNDSSADDITISPIATASINALFA